MLKVALYNLGCKVNSYEIDVMQQNLQENGFLIVPFDEMADIYLVNTCTVTNIADRKSRKMLHRARQQNPAAIVVAVGCFVQADDENLNDMSIDLAIGNNKKNDLIPILVEYIEKRHERKNVIDINKETTYEEMTLKQITNRTRAFIKIQDGCNQFCSYCIIPHVRGRVRSRGEKSIISELTEPVNKGNREVVLTGINLSAYGEDFQKKDALINLLTKLNQISDLCRIRLGSLEPQIITERFINKISGLTKVCPHFHLSLQSGCDTVLKRMNRHYTTADYAEKVELIRSVYQNKDKEPAITTDIIVGFPGETEDEFNITKEFVRQIGFSEIHVFKYSKRKGTIAANMPFQIPVTTKKSRSLVLHEIGKELNKQFLTNYIGNKVTVIPEEEKIINGIKYWLGYTAEYVRVALPLQNFEDISSTSGELIDAVITTFLTDKILLGES